MNKKRKYPLFIIDSSRAHGRGSDVDYISCTSKELPFVAAVTLHKVNEYAELYNPSDITTVWSEPHGAIRMRIKVVSELPSDYDKPTLRGLLRRAMKEMLIRRGTQYADISNITSANVVQWCTVLREQVAENLRECPSDEQQRMNLAILTKILKDFMTKTNKFYFRFHRGGLAESLATEIYGTREEIIIRISREFADMGGVSDIQSEFYGHDDRTEHYHDAYIVTGVFSDGKRYPIGFASSDL